MQRSVAIPELHVFGDVSPISWVSDGYTSLTDPRSMHKAYRLGRYRMTIRSPALPPGGVTP